MWVSERGGFRAEVNNLPAENEWRIRRHGNLLTGGKSPSQAIGAVTHRAGGEGNAKRHHAGDRGAGNLMTGTRRPFPSTQPEISELARVTGPN